MADIFFCSHTPFSSTPLTYVRIGMKKVKGGGKKELSCLVIGEVKRNKINRKSDTTSERKKVNVSV